VACVTLPTPYTRRTNSVRYMFNITHLTPQETQLLALELDTALRAGVSRMFCCFIFGHDDDSAAHARNAKRLSL